MLSLLWTSSLILSAISLLVMCILIIRRLIIHRGEERERHERKILLNSLIAFSEDGQGDRLQSVIASVLPRTALEAGFEFLALLRGEEHTRIVAALAAADLGKEAARLLRHGNEAERIHAAEMLTELGGENAAASLLQAFGRDRSTEARIAIAIGLCALGRLPPLAIVLERIGARGQRSGRLVELFKKLPRERSAELMGYARDAQEWPFIRAAAIEALAQNDGFELIEFLLALADDGAAEVSAAALRAIGRIGHPAAGAVVARAMARSEEQSYVRAEAAEAAGRIGGRDFVAPLVELLGDEAWPVRYAAAKALRLIVPEGEDALRATAASEASRRQRTASLVLAEGQLA